MGICDLYSIHKIIKENQGHVSIGDQPYLHSNGDSFYSYVSKLDHFNEPGRSLDRINNDDGYRPGNVRWATAKEQANNKRPRKKRGLSCEQRTNRSKAEGNQEI